ncbi:hypothetical protein DFH11DRAFT_1759329 [Phellopilus nigrolimitatus]|nr:hypothetical protein DFH11DRAFT_1759329 [Phellopilus nigrolimitatus]
MWSRSKRHRLCTIRFVKMGTRLKEYERARVIFKLAVERLPRSNLSALYVACTKFEKQHGTRTTLDTTVIGKPSLQYEPAREAGNTMQRPPSETCLHAYKFLSRFFSASGLGLRYHCKSREPLAACSGGSAAGDRGLDGPIQSAGRVRAVGGTRRVWEKYVLRVGGAAARRACSGARAPGKGGQAERQITRGSRVVRCHYETCGRAAESQVSVRKDRKSVIGDVVSVWLLHQLQPLYYFQTQSFKNITLGLSGKIRSTFQSWDDRKEFLVPQD